MYVLTVSARPPSGLVARQVEGLQLHGTGTSLGDPIEVGAAAGAPRLAGSWGRSRMPCQGTAVFAYLIVCSPAS